MIVIWQDSPDYILSHQGAQCKNILFVIVPTKSPCSHWSDFTLQSTLAPTTVASDIEYADWAGLGHMPKPPRLRVGEGSLS